MVSSAEHGIRFKLYHLPCHRNGVLGDAKICQTLLRQERKKPAIMRAYGCFNALWCQSMPDVGSLPLNRRRWLAADVVYDTGNAVDFIDDTVGDAA